MRRNTAANRKGKKEGNTDRRNNESNRKLQKRREQGKKEQ